jgi:hypothetical protein
MKKNIIIITLLIFLSLLFLYLLIFGRALSQKEDHFSILINLPKAFFYSEAIQINKQEYLAKNITTFIKSMEKQGFNYIEQMGSGYFLEKNNNHYISTSKMYSSHFMIFTVPKSSNKKSSNSNYSIIEITNEKCSLDNDCQTPFEYLIQSSCPYSSKCLDKICVIICPNFVNSDWQKISQAIFDCEVKSVMQAHNKEIKAELKDGRELKAIEPKIDDIINLAIQAQKKCGQIIMATE